MPHISFFSPVGSNTEASRSVTFLKAFYTTNCGKEIKNSAGNGKLSLNLIILNIWLLLKPRYLSYSLIGKNFTILVKKPSSKSNSFLEELSLHLTKQTCFFFNQKTLRRKTKEYMSTVFSTQPTRVKLTEHPSTISRRL